MTFLRRGGPTTLGLILSVVALSPLALVGLAAIIIWLTGGKP